MAVQFTGGKFHGFNDDGTPLVGGLLYTYASGTTTPQATYTDSTLGVQNANPVVLDSRGEASVWLGKSAYTMTLRRADGSLVWSQDGVSDVSGALSADLASSANGSGADLVGGVGRIVNTITALRALAKTGAGKAFVLGYYAPGDGGGGQYYYDSADTTSADNGGTIIVAADGGRWKLIITNGFVSTAQFGAKLDGVTDDTNATNAATALGIPVLIPYTAAGCVLNNANVLDNMAVFGERQGSHGGTILIVTQTGSSAFKHSASVNRFNVSFKDLSAKSTNNANTTSFYSQTNKSYYSAYFKFDNIETYGSLTISYDIFPIFVDWDNCRDGYLGTAGVQHSFIQALPTAYGQTNASNICSVRRSKIFNCVGGNAAIDAAYGVLWRFEGTDFENLAVRAFRGRALQNVSFDWCWFEGQPAGTAVAEMVLVDIYPATSAGTYPVTFRNCWGVIPNVTAQFVNIANSLCQVNAEDCEFSLVPAAVKFSNDGTRIGYMRNIQALSGAGSSGFLTGHYADSYSGSGKRLINGATDNGGGADFQQLGRYSASGGFTSTYTTGVTTAFATIATTAGVGALVLVNGYNTSSGNQGVWVVMCLGTGSVATVLHSSDATATTPSFQLSGSNLQMKTTAGTLNISSSVLL